MPDSSSWNSKDDTLGQQRLIHLNKVLNELTHQLTDVKIQEVKVTTELE